MNLFKLFMLICYLTNMKIVFSRIIELSERMKFGPLFSLRSTYFYLTFLAGNKWKKQTNDEHRLAAFYTEEIQQKELQQNKIYYEQFILKMEGIIFSVNRIFWGLTFFPLLILMTTLVISNYFIREVTVFDKLKIDLIFGINGTLWVDE